MVCANNPLLALLPIAGTNCTRTYASDQLYADHQPDMIETSTLPLIVHSRNVGHMLAHDEGFLETAKEMLHVRKTVRSQGVEVSLHWHR